MVEGDEKICSILGIICLCIIVLGVITIGIPNWLNLSIVENDIYHIYTIVYWIVLTLSVIALMGVAFGTSSIDGCDY